MSFEGIENAQKLVANTFHEIRTPLTVIKGMTHLAEKEINDQDKVLGYLSRIEAASDYLLRLINDSLYQSKVESGGFILNSEQFDLVQLIESLRGMVEVLSAKKLQKFEIVQLNPIANNLIGDQVKLHQILLNLLSNSVKYTPAEGNIQLEVGQTCLTHEGTILSFQVQDTGIGMSEEFMARMFVPYTQEQASEDRNSTGLGLYITKTLVTLMGGTMMIESKPDQGTTVTVDIPIAIASEEVERETPKTKCFHFPGKRILLVEDNEDISEIVVDLLEMSELTVVLAGNGLDAVRQVLSSDEGYFDGILMDVTMPVLDGFQATSEIRNSTHPDSKRIPIIAMTAHGLAVDVETSQKVGMNGYITKPIKIDKLFGLLNALWEN